MQKAEFEHAFSVELLTTEQAFSLIAHALIGINEKIEQYNRYMDERNGILVGIEKNVGNIADNIEFLKEEK